MAVKEAIGWKSKKNKQRVKKIELRLYNKGSHTKKSKSDLQVCIGIENSGGVGKCLVK